MLTEVVIVDLHFYKFYGSKLYSGTVFRRHTLGSSEDIDLTLVKTLT